jgi:hypothetical protein
MTDEMSMEYPARMTAKRSDPLVAPFFERGAIPLSSGFKEAGYESRQQHLMLF